MKKYYKIFKFIFHFVITIFLTFFFIRIIIILTGNFCIRMIKGVFMTKLYLAIPCYNEEEVLWDTAEKLLDKYYDMMSEGKISSDSKIVFIDDGSRDKTWDIIQDLHYQNSIFQGIKLSRNRGHQNALLAGLMTLKSKADAVISIDADLQDDINVFDEMIKKYEAGCDVVYGVRSKRETDTFFKRFTAESFYKILNRMGAKVIFNHADFRLMSRRALEAFSLYRETNIFLRGMVPLIGYKSAIVKYERSERLAGESKYPLKKMLALAWEGITSLSVQPIRIITWMGLIIFLISLIMIIYSLISFLVGASVSGWTSTLCSIWALGGLQLLAIGVIGEYIGKIYLETKRRPRYIIEEYLRAEFE